MEAQWDLRHLLDSSEVMERPISETQTRMAAWLEHIPCADLVRSVGMALRQAVAILALRGDLRQLECGNPLLRRVGLNLAERTSGKCRGHPTALETADVRDAGSHARGHSGRPFMHCGSQRPGQRQLDEPATGNQAN